jgi:hypothetical protein
MGHGLEHRGLGIRFPVGAKFFIFFIFIVFIVYNVSFFVCLVFLAVYFQSGGVILCGVYLSMLCLIIVPLPPDKNPFEVRLNNNNNNNNNNNVNDDFREHQVFYAMDPQVVSRQ